MLIDHGTYSSLMSRGKVPSGPLEGYSEFSVEPDPDDLEEAISELARMVVEGEVTSREQLQEKKMELLKGSNADTMPSNPMVLDHIKDHYPSHYATARELLAKKPSRTLSGVAVVAVMTSPYPCPHGRCIFCPGGTESPTPTPQSYTGKEPAAMRAAQNEYDPFRQTRNRIEQLGSIGHPTDKVDLILMGGTITDRPRDYQASFVKGCLDGLNGLKSGTFEEAARLNERSHHRCIGMTFETRPDRLGSRESDLILSLGGTRVELGVQSLYDGPLKRSGRGHTVEHVVDATRMARDCGLKIGYHLMPGIPGSDPNMDVGTASRAFEDERFRPDMIKIYPALVIAGTKLYDEWKRGEYSPLSTEEAADVVARIKRTTPAWVRIQRVQRDIPSGLIEGGVKKSNLRQISQALMAERGWRCDCIRCREIGHRLGIAGQPPEKKDVAMGRIDYGAGGGKEAFISMDTDGGMSLIGYVRLRRPSQDTHRKEMSGASVVRELKVFGPLVPIGARALKEWQHRGFGQELLLEAERVTSDEWGLDNILVNSGIGTREYYRKLGYERKGPYMAKALRGDPS